MFEAGLDRWMGRRRTPSEDASLPAHSSAGRSLASPRHQLLRQPVPPALSVASSPLQPPPPSPASTPLHLVDASTRSPTAFEGALLLLRPCLHFLAFAPRTFTTQAPPPSSSHHQQPTRTSASPASHPFLPYLTAFLQYLSPSLPPYAPLLITSGLTSTSSLQNLLGLEPDYLKAYGKQLEAGIGDADGMPSIQRRALTLRVGVERAREEVQ